MPNPFDVKRDLEHDPSSGPRANTPRRGVALCLSGGGYRAALFHLGGLSRLNELGVLSKVDTFSCVSGGSILGAYLARLIQDGYAPSGGVYPDWWAKVVEGFLPVVKQNIRTGPVLRQAKFWKKGVGPESLAKHYKAITGGMSLSDLPERPNFVFCATNLVFGNSWISSKARVGDYISGYVSPPPASWTVAKAVAASSCFPPAFLPLPTGIPAADYRQHDGTPPDDDLDSWRESIGLSDGGVYDNLGLEPVWKSHETVLVSDGGAPMKPKAPWGPATLLRYSSVLTNQIGAVRKRWLIDIYERNEEHQPDTFNGTYWGIESATRRYDENASYGYSKKLAKFTIATVRTDLDPFTPNECWVLIKHGYELADVALRTHEPRIMAKDPPRRTWSPALLDEAKVGGALRDSGKRRYLFARSSDGNDSLVKA